MKFRSTLRRLALALPFVAGPASAAEKALGPQDVLEDRTMDQWSARWWQWNNSFGRGAGPTADPDGALCAQKQKGNVWFLVGVSTMADIYGSDVTRTCEIPAGKHIFFAINTWVFQSNVTPFRKENCEKLQQAVIRLGEPAYFLGAQIDGERLAADAIMRLATEKCFASRFRDTGDAVDAPTAAFGYYVMLKPLPPGEHVLKFHGYSNGNAQNMTYRLRVRPPD